jgi:hypothetical protein
MGLQVSTPSPAIGLNDFWAIKSDALKGIDSDENDTRIRVDTMLSIS